MTAGPSPRTLEQTSAWDRDRPAFLACHRSRLNVALHLVTTPLGIWAGLALLAEIDPAIAIFASTAYLLWLTRVLPPLIWWPNAAIVAAALFAALANPLEASRLLILVGVAYAGQDLAHRITGEAAFEHTYRDAPDRWIRWAEHCLLLLPLLLAALPRSQGSAIAWIRPRRSVLRGRLTRVSEQNDAAALRDWVSAQEAPPGTSTHWWREDLPGPLANAFDRIVGCAAIEDMLRARHGQHAVILPVRAMNEVYVAGPDRPDTSDRVFFVPHIDGPFSVFPGATVYRCLVALTPNDRIATCFPLEGALDREHEVVLDEAEILAFDYHRTPHYIRTVNGHEDGTPCTRRATLKLHYAIAPQGFGLAARWLSDLSTRYNTRARALFLDTLAPDRLLARAGARVILFQTHLWQHLARWVGHRNLFYLTALAVLSLLSGSAIPLVAGGSFIHYFMYMAVFGNRDDVSFGTFKRDAIFYKTVSMSILAVLYLSQRTLDPVSLLLIVSGFGLSALAAAALGVDRTYFGAELGHCRPKRIDRFPYGFVPHPMILGSILGLLGVLWLDPFRAAWPWLVPTHIALYLCHLLQEARAPFPLDKRGGARTLRDDG